MLRCLDRVIVMTRFPEPGKTKTRLIPALGSDRAAALHRCLIRRTLDVVCHWAETHACDVEVRYVGGDEVRFRTEFGIQCRYAPQSEGSLGERMNAAIAAAFSEGAIRVVVIGTDCPGLDDSHLGPAFDQLTLVDAVIGPATDGGYYLLGMRRPLPRLFDDIAWGTENVLRQTLERSVDARVTVGQLSPLSDIDYPEDLVHCRRIADQFRDVLPSTTAGRISIIIPTLNEAANIAARLEQIRDVPNVEVIVADGGSEDQTVVLARAAGATVVQCNQGRGKQMNAGAALASGEILLFLHADTRLPHNFSDHVWQVMQDGPVAGAFRLHIDGSGCMLRFVEFAANLRSRWLQLPYGDQAIFVRASTFFQMNGFQNWPLMEDYDFCQRLKRIGKMSLVPATVKTSPRRWHRLGVLRTTFANLTCVLGFRLGVSSTTLARWYRR